MPALYKIFDEILVNAADNLQRDPEGMDAVKVDIDQESGVLLVWNNGRGLPVVMHKEQKAGASRGFNHICVSCLLMFIRSMCRSWSSAICSPATTTMTRPARLKYFGLGLLRSRWWVAGTATAPSWPTSSVPSSRSRPATARTGSSKEN